MLKYERLRIDGVVGEVYDVDAIHENQLAEVLTHPAIKTALLNILYPVGSYYISNSSTNPATLFGGRWQKLEGRFLLGAGSSYSLGATGGSANAIVVQHNHTASGTVTSAGAHTHTVTGTAASNGAHTHTVSGTAASAGSHTHTIDTKYKVNYLHGGTNRDSVNSTGTNIANSISTARSAGAHTHTVSGSAASAGAHTHTTSGTAKSAGAHTHSTTVTVANKGESGTGKNMPPYRAVNIWYRTA